jgi:hypothetical protein
VLLPVVLFAVAALPSSMLRCRYSGLQVSACCCPKGDAAETPAQPTVREADCCDRELVAVARPPVERQPSSATLGLVAFEIAKAVLDAEHFPAASVNATTGTADAHVPGPPLLLVKRAWLI